ncbi:MAG: hypothetical protein PHW82_09980 [Bacteroidales bacterium]|nr:hypothetical protein [Bacteroidales bacterium]
MKKILFLVLLVFPFCVFAQSLEFEKTIQKTKQSYIDRGYKPVVELGDSISTVNPLVTPIINLDYNTYYIVVVQLDGCFYCEYDLQFVDSEEYLFKVDYEFEVKNGIKQGIYKFTNDENKTGKYVVFLDSDLPYYANVFVFKR